MKCAFGACNGVKAASQKTNKYHLSGIFWFLGNRLCLRWFFRIDLVIENENLRHNIP